MTTVKEGAALIYSYFRPHRRLILSYVLLLFILSILDVFRVSLIYPIANFGIGTEGSGTILDTLFATVIPEGANQFVWAAYLLLGATLFVAAIEVLVAYMSSKTFAVVRDDIDRKVFGIIKSQPYEFFTKNKQGDLLYLGQEAVEKAGQLVKNCSKFIQHFVLCLFYLSFLFILSVEATLFIIGFGLIYILLVKKVIYSRVYAHASIINRSKRHKSVVYNEFITGIKTITITDSVSNWVEKYNTAVKKLKRSITRGQTYGKVPSVVNNLMVFLVISLGALAIYYLSQGDFRDQLAFFGVFVLALYRLIPAMNNAQTSLTQIIDNYPMLENVDALIQENKNGVSIDKIRKASAAFNDKISFENVSFHYNDTKDCALSDVTFNILKNQKVAIVGSSGAGKTTIANLLARLYEPSEGRIKMDGVDLSEIDKSDYRRKLGYIGQETFIFHDTIRENIRFGGDFSDEEIIEAAEHADALDFIMNTPQGLDTVIGDQGMRLSGGQRQRVAIARVILRKPEILLLDESTSSLDNISEQKVMEAIEAISNNMTVIIIAHRLSTVQDADVINVLKGGLIVESGSHDELMTKGEEYYNLYTKYQENQ